MEMKTIWSEMVKPRDRTPDHLKTHRLSVLDQLAPLIHFPILLFYSAASTKSSSNPEQLMMMLKVSLPKALSQFYPLAGRFLDDSTLICDDQGALLIHTQVPCSLKSYFSLIGMSIDSNDDDHVDDHKEPPLRKLLPSRALLHGSHQHEPVPISAWVQLGVQVNVFECGGVVIGCYASHKLMDGISASTFLRHWAGLTQGLGPEYLIKPNFDAIVAAFPPRGPGRLPSPAAKSREEWLEDVLKSTANTTIRLKIFVFKPAAISAIMEKATSSSVPNPSRVESVVGFLWKNFFEAEDEALEQIRSTTDLVLTAELRSRARPSLPRESMGNLLTTVLARADKNELGDMVAKIRGAINELRDEKIKELQGEKGGEALSEHNQMIMEATTVFKPSAYRVSSQCRVGFMNVDFGFGKPIWTSLLDGVMLPFSKNFIVLMDHIDLSHAARGNGIEAWVILDKKQMQRLETNPDFLAFASPIDLNFN